MEWTKRMRQFFIETKQHIAEERSEREIWKKSESKLKEVARDVGEDVLQRSNNMAREAEQFTYSLGERMIRVGERVEEWFQRKKSAERSLSPIRSIDDSEQNDMPRE